MNLIKDSIKLIKIKPKLIVFDLDRTLWDLGIDDFMFTPPYSRKKIKNGTEEKYKIYDSENKEMKPFSEVNDILNFLTVNLKIELAAASRTTFPPGSLSLINLLDWKDFFKYKEIYPGCKYSHFKKIKEASKIDYKDMIFFDDEERNIIDITKLNVTCVKIDPYVGMNYNYLKHGFDIFENKNNLY